MMNYSIEKATFLRQSMQHKGGTIRNPELFELRVHPPPEKKNKIMNIIPAV